MFPNRKKHEANPYIPCWKSNVREAFRKFCVSQSPDQHAARNRCDIEKEVYIRRELHAFFTCVSVRVCMYSTGKNEFYAYITRNLKM